MGTALDAALSGNDKADSLVRELLDDAFPLSISSLWPSLSLMTGVEVKDSSFVSNNDPNNKKLISTVYSDPTLGEVENALSVSTDSKVQPRDDLLSPRISILEGGLKKIESKYTLKIKSSGHGMADDGYKWRKYGQKSIKNHPNPR
ncbi:WRKY Transcription Factor [Ancistrocladus abbreviatus]